jgi:hypothetical protein
MSKHKGQFGLFDIDIQLDKIHLLNDFLPKLKVRCRIEHIFGAMKGRCWDEVLRSIGARARFWIS